MNQLLGGNKEHSAFLIILNQVASDYKSSWTDQYKVLRNKVTCQIRKESIDFNNNRVFKAKNEGELWKIANEVLKPKSDSKW